MGQLGKELGNVIKHIKANAMNVKELHKTIFEFNYKKFKETPDDTIYIISHQEGENVCTVFWTEESAQHENKIRSVQYSVTEALSYFNNGTWIKL